MLHSHLPKRNKHRSKAPLSRKDFSVQILFLFASKVTSSLFLLSFWEMVPLTSPVGAVHKSEQDFFLPSHIPELNNPSQWQQAGCPCGCHQSGSVSSRHGRRQRRCTRAPGTGNPRQSSSIRKHHTLHSLLRRFHLKSSHLSLASTFATPNLFPHGMFCFIVTTCLHFLNCLGVSMQLG